MRVLLTAIQTTGGIRTFLRYVYSRPEFADCEMSLVASDASIVEYLDRFLPPGRIHVIPVGAGHRRFVSQVRHELRARRFDLLHSHGFTAGVLSAGARAEIRTPHLMTAHDVFNRPQFAGLAGTLRRTIVGLAFSQMDGIHTVTEGARDNFLAFFPRIRRERVHGILHGIDTEMFQTGMPTDLHAELGIDRSVPLIGFFGRFMAQKGFRDLVHAMGIIAERRPVSPLPRVVTFGWGGFIREDYAYIARRGLSEHFVRAPHTDNMPGALKGVSVVAMPSRWEACGLLAMEALVAGVPIVGTNCVGLNEVLAGSPACVVDPQDPEALATALAEALAPTERRAFEEYRPVARERFAIERPARDLRKLYAEVASCGRRALGG